MMAPLVGGGIIPQICGIASTSAITSTAILVFEDVPILLV